MLNLSLLPVLRETYSRARIVLACPHELRNLHEHRPEIDSIVTFERFRAQSSKLYRWSIIWKLRRLRADLAINPQFTRDKLSSQLTVFSGARCKVGFDAELRAMLRPGQFHRWKKYQAAFDHLCAAEGPSFEELERYSLMLHDLGIQSSVSRPQFPIADEDAGFADNFFKGQKSDNLQWVAIFTGTADKRKIYPGIGKALRSALTTGHAVLALGSAEDHATCAKELEGLPLPTANLCGQVTLRQAAALLKRCSLAVGLDTGLAHLACAVGCPQVVIMGGYDFGRFFPYSHLTSLVCLPLDCYHCLGNCQFSEIHCIGQIQSETVAEAIRQTLTIPSIKPRIFFQRALPQLAMDESCGIPAWKMPGLAAKKDWETKMV